MLRDKEIEYASQPWKCYCDGKRRGQLFFFEPNWRDMILHN